MSSYFKGHDFKITDFNFSVNTVVSFIILSSCEARILYSFLPQLYAELTADMPAKNLEYMFAAFIVKLRDMILLSIFKIIFHSFQRHDTHTLKTM